MATHVFIFRRDLRLDDNTCLIELCKSIPSTDVILPIFIFNKQQIDRGINKYFSQNTVEFLVKTLIDLDEQLKTTFKSQLFVFETDKTDLTVLNKLHKALDIKTIAFNSDITPYARKRDQEIIQWCEQHKIRIITSFKDYVLIDPTSMEKPYQVFTPFYKKYLATLKGINVEKCPLKHQFASPKLSIKCMPIKEAVKYYQHENPNLAFPPGRKHALNILNNIRKKGFKDYKDKRDLVYLDDGTTHLSAYLKYGSISVREAAQAALDAHTINHELLRQFIWRSFYDQIVYHFPRTLEGQNRLDHYNKSLRESYDHIKWDASKKHFEAWCQGNTGFPIVDAGMRQLNTTGYMHNRVRMIVASFLIKDLHIDWRKGEHYFATQLVDYYPSANNGGWTFASGSGADAQQYNRIFNPWLQSAKFDPNCEYIKKWLPELSSLEPKEIHQWFKYSSNHVPHINYPQPIIDHSLEANKSKAIYKQYLYKS